jgi:putative FmdB family regulatory protein
MPIYEYKCSNCDHSFEIVQGVKDPVKKKCSECKQFGLERLLFPVMGCVKEIRTLGQLAEKNTKLAGSSLQNPETEKMLANKARTRELNQINRMTNKEKKKFIEGK